MLSYASVLAHDTPHCRKISYITTGAQAATSKEERGNELVSINILLSKQNTMTIERCNYTYSDYFSFQTLVFQSSRLAEAVYQYLLQ